jgi:hypothetical protein
MTKPVRGKLGSGASSHLDTFIAAPKRLIFTKDATLYGQRREMSRRGAARVRGMRATLHPLTLILSPSEGERRMFWDRRTRAGELLGT